MMNITDKNAVIVITPCLWYLSCGTFSFSCYLLKTMRTNYIDSVFYSEFYCVTGSLWFLVSRMTHSWSVSDVFVAPMWIHRSRSVLACTCNRSHHLSFDDGGHCVTHNLSSSPSCLYCLFNCSAVFCLSSCLRWRRVDSLRGHRGYHLLLHVLPLSSAWNPGSSRSVSCCDTPPHQTPRLKVTLTFLKGQWSVWVTPRFTEEGG